MMSNAVMSSSSYQGGSNNGHGSLGSNSNKSNSLANSQNGRVDFASVLKKSNATPIPPALSRKLGRGSSESPLGKVKVMLRVCENPEEASGPGILGVDQRRKQVTLIDPGGTGPNGITPEERRVGVSAPKMFGFDGIFSEDDDQAEICASAAAELVASVISGEDGCLVALGYCSAGKKQTMFGKPSTQKLGMIPTAISWLFKSIQEQKQKTGSRFSVRVSALEVTGGSVHETITDLLLPFVNDGDQPPGAYLLDGNGSAVNGHKGSTLAKSVTAPVLNSVSEVRSPNPETAGYYLDSALDAINAKAEGGSGGAGHIVFTLHVYQYSIDKNGKGVVGGRSKLHCVLLGNGSPSISVLSGLLLAVLNGQRHLPSSNHSKLGAILRECLGSLTCRAVVMIHISNSHSRYAETLAALQLGSRVHRLRRSRRLKMGSVGSGTGSGGSSGGSGEEMRNGLGTTNQVGEGETSSDIDPSSSEQSCDTVIYLGPSIDEATDGEHPPSYPVYLPSLETTENGCNMKIIPSKCPPLNNGSSVNGPNPKTKSPKPKSSNKILPDSSSFVATAASGLNGSGVGGNKSEEKWVDGPKVTKYHRQLQNHLQPPSSPKKKGGGCETWIDGPGVNHQANNFPSPKKSVNQAKEKATSRGGGGLAAVGSCSNASPSSDPCLMTSTKAEMIQKWISNQTHSPTFFDDISKLDDSFFGGTSQIGSIFSGPPSQILQNKIGGNIPYFFSNSSGDAHFNSFYPEPEYKALTVFKTCDEEDPDEGRDEDGYEFEFIEVVEPEVPVPTNDVCLQVTEEDIALSFLLENRENPLPESDQNYVMSSGGFLDKFRSASFSECPEHVSSSSFPTLDKSDHPLRVLSQECLTVVDTFTDSLSISGGDLERFWQSNNGFHDANHKDNHEMKICHGLCKNLVTLSQMSLDNLNDYPLEPLCMPLTPFTLSQPQPNGPHTKCYEDQPPLQHKPPTGKLILKEPPVLSSNDATVFVKSPGPPTRPRISSLTVHSRKSTGGKDLSDAEQDAISIPPMDLLDVNQIKNNCHPMDNNCPIKVQPKLSVHHLHHVSCDHNHRQNDQTLNINNGTGSGGLLSSSNLNNTNASSSTLNGSASSTLSIHSSLHHSDATPPQSLSPEVIPIQLLETNGKSPSKSKSRKIARFFRSRSKSPKKVLAAVTTTSSSESGKSSVSSSDAKHSSSASSCSSGVSIPGSTTSKSQKQHSSPKHQSPSKKQQSLKSKVIHSGFVASSNGADYHFTCDSALPMFLPNPNPNSKVLNSSTLENCNSGMINGDGLENSK
ncbi:uncharacterized protein LOC110843535 isoform X2 [Folsomia candida]|nr:uncharacterized protein LOC110843535 isoform X2 [Folsomia candida]